MDFQVLLGTKGVFGYYSAMIWYNTSFPLRELNAICYGAGI